VNHARLEALLKKNLEGVKRVTLSLEEIKSLEKVYNEINKGNQKMATKNTVLAKRSKTDKPLKVIEVPIVPIKATTKASEPKPKATTKKKIPLKAPREAVVEDKPKTLPTASLSNKELKKALQAALEEVVSLKANCKLLSEQSKSFFEQNLDLSSNYIAERNKSWFEVTKERLTAQWMKLVKKTFLVFK
jgi:hypothetical protein